ncbi:MAG: hypothetical protein ACXABO_16155 [Promethearchaeota archaeon]|jgi:hypothetical protein
MNINKKFSLLGIFLIGFLLLSTSFGLVAADEDDDDDGIDDDFEEENKRDIELQFDSDEIQIESHLRSGDIVDEINLKIKFDSDGLSIKITYETEIENEIDNSTEPEFEVEFEVEFKKLIEYVDVDSNGLYDKSIDQLVQEVPLNSFQPAVYISSPISLDTTLHYIILNTTDGVFAAHVFFVEEFVVINETYISPTQTKIDIEITNFNYLSIDSQIALYVKLSSEAGYEEDDETNDEEDGFSTEEDGVFTELAGFTGIFTWKENALIDGMTMDVLSSALEEDDEDELEEKVILNYPRGNHIYHDPKVGIVLGQISATDFPLVITGTFFAIIGITAIALVIILKRRRT